MWCIVWKIDNTVRQDSLSFESREQATKFADYYKRVLILHNQGGYLRARFMPEDSISKNELTVSFQIIKKISFTAHQKSRI
jgi:hypothetical protein